jgi:hypothetical protein
VVNVVSISNGWAKINLDGTTVYAPSNYLEKITTSEMPPTTEVPSTPETPSTPEIPSNPEEPSTPEVNEPEISNPEVSEPTVPNTPSEPTQTPDGITTIKYRVTGDIYFRDAASWSANKGRIIKKDEIVEITHFGDTWKK